MEKFSTAHISRELIEEIKEALEGKNYGSIEIYIEDGKVTQITERTIKKYKVLKSFPVDKRQ